MSYSAKEVDAMLGMSRAALVAKDTVIQQQSKVLETKIGALRTDNTLLVTNLVKSSKSSINVGVH
jgi:hypothetical protein